MPAILFGIAGLFQRAQHEETENSLFWLAGDLLREFLIHARGDVDFLGHFDFADTLAGAASVAAVGF